MRFFTTFFVSTAVMNAVLAPTASFAATTASPMAEAIKEGVQVEQRDGYTATVTTKVIHETLETYVKKLKNNGAKLYAANGSTGVVQPDWLQNDSFSGNGSLYNSAVGQTGYIYAYNGHIGLGFFSGHVDAYLVATGASSNKARMKVTTYGIVGGSSVVARDYVFAPSSYSNGSSNFTVNEDLNGTIAYYQISVYGDHNTGGTYWNSQANLSFN